MAFVRGVIVSGSEGADIIALNHGTGQPQHMIYEGYVPQSHIKEREK